MIKFFKKKEQQMPDVSSTFINAKKKRVYNVDNKLLLTVAKTTHNTALTSL